MKKLLMKFFSILLSIFCIVGLGTPIYAEGETNYFSFKENNVKLYVGDQYQIQYDISEDLKVKDAYIFEGEEFIDFDKDTLTVTAKEAGSASIYFEIEDLNNSNSRLELFYVNIGKKITSFKWSSNPDFEVINTSVENYQNDFFVDYTCEPSNWEIFADDIDITVDDPEGVVTQDENNANHFYANKSGTFSVTGTANGSSDTTEVHVLMGNYVENTDTTWITKLLKVGESFDLKSDLLQYFYPKNADFSDEKFEFKKSYETSAFELNDGVVKGKSYGSGQVVTTLANGTQITYNITVADEPTWIAFEQKEYSYGVEPWSYSLQNLLISDNNNSIRSVPEDQITYSVDNSDVAEINGEYIYFKKAGDVTVTAKYKELTASCVMHVYEGDDPYAFDKNNIYTVKIHTGKSKKIEYKLGSKNSIEKVSISNGFQADTEVSEEKAKFDKKTQMFTAYEDGYYYLKLTDKLGKTNSWSIDVGPEVTSFKFVNKEKIYTAREGSNRSESIQYTIKPNNASHATEIKYEIVDGDSSAVEISEYGSVRIKKAGKVTVKATTDNGLSDTMVIDARIGNYAESFSYNNSDEHSYTLKVGETINIKDDVESMLEPKGADFSDEKLTYSISEYEDEGIVSVTQDGTITALQNGSTQVKVTTVGGYSKYLTVAVMDELKNLKFKKSNAEIALTDYDESRPSSNSLWLGHYLVTDPEYASKTLKYSEIEFTSSNPEVGKVVMKGSNPVFEAYKDGSATVTAKYKGFTTSMNIDVYTPTPATSMDMPSEVTLHKGYGNSYAPKFNKHADKSITAELVSGADIVKFSSYSTGFYVGANKIGTAVVKVTSTSNPKLTKTVKIKTVEGLPNGSEVSIIDEKTKQEYSSPVDCYNLKLNQRYTIHLKNDTTEYLMGSGLYDQLSESDLVDTYGYGSDTGEPEEINYEEYLTFRTKKTGSITVEVFPGYKITLNIGETGFIDTPADSTPHNDDVQWLASSGISTGYPDGTFRPYVEVARCDMAAFIRRLAKNNNWLDAAAWTASEADWNTFKDIDKSSPHAEDVLWLAHAEISQGWDVGNGQKEFRPFAIVARCDMAAFLHRLASKAGVSDASTWKPSEADWTFADIDAGSPHAEDVLWLAHSEVSKGWDEGNGTTTFRPLNNVARCDMAAFLHRLDNLK